jgi:hypothetical protein
VVSWYFAGLEVIEMLNRRTFFLQCAGSMAYATARKVIAQSPIPVQGTYSGVDREDYALWSRLIECKCQCDHIRGYLIAQTTTRPDGLPTLPSTEGQSLKGIRQAIYRNEHPEARYETDVPEEWRTAFSEAVEEAKPSGRQVVALERRFTFKKHYLLLSQTDIDAYQSLTPPVVSAGWHPDPALERKYKGYEGITYLSLPFYDHAHRLALVWERSDGPGCSTWQWYFFTGSENGWSQQKWNSGAYEECS